MADAQEITVAIEKAVHNAMSEVAQAIYDQHGIKILDAQIEWIDVSSTSEDKALIQHITLRTSTRA